MFPLPPPQTCQRGARPSLFKNARLYESLFQAFPSSRNSGTPVPPLLRNPCRQGESESMPAGVHHTHCGTLPLVFFYFFTGSTNSAHSTAPSSTFLGVPS